MARNPHRQIQGDGPTDMDELTAWGGGARVEGLPSDEGLVGQAPGFLPIPVDYAGGVLVGHGEEADAQAAELHHRIISARVDAPRQYELPHEATHRRYEPLQVVVVNQAAAGFLPLAQPNRGLHFVKLIACNLTLDAAGTLKFVQGGDGVTAPPTSGDLSGLMNMGGASAPPLNLPPADLANPWLYTAPDQPFGIVTATGKAQGWVTVCYSPYDA